MPPALPCCDESLIFIDGFRLASLHLDLEGKRSGSVERADKSPQAAMIAFLEIGKNNALPLMGVAERGLNQVQNRPQRHSSVGAAAALDMAAQGLQVAA